MQTGYIKLLNQICSGFISVSTDQSGLGGSQYSQTLSEDVWAS